MFKELFRRIFDDDTMFRFGTDSHPVTSLPVATIRLEVVHNNKRTHLQTYLADVAGGEFTDDLIEAMIEYRKGIKLVEQKRLESIAKQDELRVNGVTIGSEKN